MPILLYSPAVGTLLPEVTLIYVLSASIFTVDGLPSFTVLLFCAQIPTANPSAELASILTFSPLTLIMPGSTSLLFVERIAFSPRASFFASTFTVTFLVVSSPRFNVPPFITCLSLSVKAPAYTALASPSVLVTDMFIFSDAAFKTALSPTKIPYTHCVSLRLISAAVKSAFLSPSPWYINSAFGFTVRIS